MLRHLMALVLVCLPVYGRAVFTSVGSDAHAFALGNNFTALANDYSAVFWNPAGLAFMPIRELRFTLEANQRRVETELGENKTDTKRQRLRVGDVGLVRSFPTSRGGLAIAFGYSSPYLLDDLRRYSGSDTYVGGDVIETESGAVPLEGTEFSFGNNTDYAFGRLDFWSGALGIQIAPGLGCGVSLSLVTGRQTQYLVAQKLGSLSSGQTIGEDSKTTMERGYLGYDARIGLLYSLTERIKAGLRLELPRTVWFDEDEHIEDRITGTVEANGYKGKLKSPFRLGGGIGAILPFGTVSVDASVRAPSPRAAEDDEFSYWRGGAGIGVEVPIGRPSVLLRGGYRWSDLHASFMRVEYDDDPLGTQDGNVHEETDRHLVTGGVAFLAKETFALELAYGYSFWSLSSTSQNWERALHENHSQHRASVSVSMRY